MVGPLQCGPTIEVEIIWASLNGLDTFLVVEVYEGPVSVAASQDHQIGASSVLGRLHTLQMSRKFDKNTIQDEMCLVDVEVKSLRPCNPTRYACKSRQDVRRRTLVNKPFHPNIGGARPSISNSSIPGERESYRLSS